MRGDRYSIGRAARRRWERGAAPPPSPQPLAPGAAPTAFASPPALHYHIPAGSTVATQTIAAQPAAVQAATAVSDLRGLAHATNALGSGPLVMVDALGRKFLRFTNTAGTGTNGDGPNGPNLLRVGTAFTASQRAVACFMVGRHHKASTTTFFSLGVAGASPPNTGGGVLRTAALASGGSVALFGAGSRPATGASANVAALYPGSQLQVLGTSSRSVSGTGANGGQRLSINLHAGNVDRSSAALSGVGATIGSYAFAPGSSDHFDLYEMVVFTGELTDAQHDAVAAALVANWSIPAVTDQLVLEGDSITAGIPDAGGAAGTGVISGGSLGMLLTEPGAELIPPTCRVINQGVSGNAVANLVARRDSTGAVFDAGRLAAGRNIVAVQIGRNDWTSAPASGTATYQAIVAMLNTAATGYLQRGWEVVQAINIAASASVQGANDVQRAALRDPQFLVDTLSGAGQAHAGKVTRLELALIASGGTDVFKDAAAAATDAAVYQGASKTHPTRDVGTPLMATGGDTPHHGYGAIL